MDWFKLALSEPDGTPSSQRLCLFVLLVFTLNLISCAFYLCGRLPDVPPSLADLIEWLFSFAVGGVALGKVAGAVASFGNKNGAGNASNGT